ncbi:MAG: hypothetical protein HOQ05_13985 [Corynebacteriales bacterium]|nr:hypothetical protein [Mycobacteriales bacterium]
MELDALPHVDEHETIIEASTEDVWRAVSETMDRSTSGSFMRFYARLVGCADHTASGPRPFAEGSTIPGFRVAAAHPWHELVLTGRHRFSTYALIFRFEQLSPARTRLRAETRAAFPGVFGAGYRGLVIGTRGHVVGMRRILAGIRRRSERRRDAGA